LITYQRQWKQTHVRISKTTTPVAEYVIKAEKNKQNNTPCGAHPLVDCVRTTT